MSEWTSALPADAQIVTDMARMPHAILTGIGFLGAGVIFREGASVHGLTTAASLWLTAALGIVFGIGLLELGTIGTVAALAVLIVLRVVQRISPPRPVVRLEVVVKEEARADGAQLIALLDRQGYRSGSLSIRHDRARGLRRYMLMVSAQTATIDCEHLAKVLHGEVELQELAIMPPPKGTLARLGGPEAPALNTLPIFAPLADDPPSAQPAGLIDLWVISLIPGMYDAVTDIVAANFPGLRIARRSRPPQGLAAVLHVLSHAAVAVAGVAGPEAMRNAACDWLRGIARVRQAALFPGCRYAEVRAEDLPASGPTVVLAVRDLLLGRAGEVRFMRPGPIHLSACPGPEVRRITTPMARDLGYGWSEPE